MHQCNRDSTSLVSQPHHTFGWRYLQEHEVSHQKFQQFLPLIGVALLPTLCSYKSLTDQIHLVHIQLHQLRTKKLSLAYFAPANWRSAKPTIQDFVWHHPNARVVIVVVGELYQRQVVLPASLEIKGTSSKHIL